MSNTGKVIKSTGSWYYVKSGEKIIRCKLKGKFKLKGLRTTNPVAVGDDVDFIIKKEENRGLINKIHERKNAIIRRSTNLSRYAHTIASNIDTAFLIITLKLPKTYPLFIDRFLVASEKFKIPTVLIFNKIDLYSEEEKKELTYLKSIYEKIGYNCVEISVKENINIAAISELVKNKVILISGNSGVGKSSLLNLLQPGLNLKTDKISEYHEQGKHTTTFAEMFEIADGMLIDTPGIKGFGLTNIAYEKLSHYFPEMNKLRKKCKFNNCTHTHEPDCEIKKAVNEKVINKLRYNNYISILTDDTGKYREDAFR